MRNNLTPEQIRKRLAELEILEKKEKTKLEKLRKKLEVLDVLENKEKKKLEILRQKKIQEEKKIAEKNAAKKTPKKRLITWNIMKNLAGVWLIAVLMGWDQKILKSKGENTTKEEAKKEIILLDKKNKIIETKDTTLEINRSENKPIEKTPVVQEKKKTPVSTIKKTVNVNTTTEDEVFRIIETVQLDSKNNTNINDRYTDRKSLSSANQNIVKAIYKNITNIENKDQIKTIIDGLDKDILLWLNDICIKKSYLLKKAGKIQELEKMRVITQQIMTRKNEIINSSKTIQTVERIKEIQKAISKYTIDPIGFTIEKIAWDKVFEYNSNQNKSLIERVTAINFTIKHNGKALGTIRFDTNGNLITKYIFKDNQTYTVSQNRTTIKITEGYLVNN